MQKSDGQIRFEQELALLEARMERGEIGVLEAGGEFDRIRRESSPLMTPAERDSLQRLELKAHAVGAEIMATHGKPVPGNDPRKPN